MHALGVTHSAEMSSTSSEGITPPSSLLRAHASDQNPPHRFRSPYTEGLCRLPSAPCWKLALPDVISTTCVKALGPIPRRVPDDPVRLHVLANAWTSRSPDIGLAPVLRSSARESLPAMQLQQGGSFRGCSHSLMFRLLYLLGPPVAPTAVPGTGQPGRLHHAMNMWLPALITQGFT